jgi:ABC-type multidrug transport system fused ATPase/permease subunit
MRFRTTMLRNVIKRLVLICFEWCSRNADADLRDGWRLAVGKVLEHRWLMGGLFLGNLLAGIFEGGTIAILALAATILVEGQSAGLVLPKFAGINLFVDGVLEGIGMSGVFLLLVVLAVLAQIIKSVMTYMGKYFSIRLQFVMTREVQDEATAHVMRYSYGQVIKTSSGEMGAIIGQTSQIAGIVAILNRGALSVTMLVTYITLMLLLSVTLSLTALLLIAIIFIGMSRIVGIIKSLGDKIVNATLEMGRVMVELLHAPRLLRVFGATGYAKRKINDARGIVIEAQQRSVMIKAVIDPVIDSMTIIAAGAFLIGGYLTTGERAVEVIPKLLLFLFMLNRMMPHAKSLNEVRMGFAGSIRVFSLAGNFFRPEDKVFTRVGGYVFDRISQGINLEKVSFSYSNTATPALTGITFNVQQGQTVALVGGSGGGKTTITSLLLGLYEPGSGVITVDGVDLQTIDLHAWTGLIGCVEQDIFLLNATIRDNIAFASNEYSLGEIINVAKAAHIHEFIQTLPLGYDTVIGDRGSRLSGGQQQRLGLARALLRKPQLLLLDEATSSLDVESERFIQKSLLELRESVTIIVIAHRLSTIAHADKIIVIDNGTVIEQGSLEELLSNEHRFSQLWKLQSSQV